MRKQYLVVHHTVGPDPLDDRYHGVIYPDGKFFHRMSIHAPGAATLGSNSRTANIALVGNFELERPSAAALKTLVQVLVAWRRVLDLPVDRIVSHGWIGQNLEAAPRYSTACCGRFLERELLVLRKKVAAYG